MYDSIYMLYPEWENLWSPQVGGTECGVTAARHGISFRGNENVQKLDCDDGCRIL